VRDLKWPAVTVIIALLAVLGALAYFGKDAATVLAGVITVLGALGFGYTFNRQAEIQQSTARIEENTNGRIGQLVAMVEKQQRDQQAQTDQHRRDMREMADKLAMMTPPDSTPLKES
jgi:hypothetical protein